MQRFCPQRLTKSLVRSLDTLKEDWGCLLEEREVFAGGVKLYMAVILRTGRSFLPLEDCTTTVLLAAQKFLTNCRARPNGSKMGRVLRMRDDGMDHWWQSAHVAQVWPRGVLGWHTVSVVPMESSCGAGSWRSRAKKSLSWCRTAHRDTTQSCAFYLDTLLLLLKTWKFKVDNDKSLSSSSSATVFVNTETCWSKLKWGGERCICGISRTRTLRLQSRWRIHLLIQIGLQTFLPLDPFLLDKRCGGVQKSNLCTLIKVPYTITRAHWQNTKIPYS